MNFLLASSDSGDTAAVWTFLIIYLVVFLIVVAGMWKVFTKADEAGWKSIIPIYNVWVLLRIVGRPGWWLILFLIPFVNFIIWIIVANDISKSYGKGVGFTVGLVLLAPLFIVILGWGAATYVGPAGSASVVAPSTPPPPPPPPQA